MRYTVTECGETLEILKDNFEDAMVAYLQEMFGFDSKFINDIPLGSFHESEDVVITDKDGFQETYVYCAWGNNLVYYW